MYLNCKTVFYLITMYPSSHDIRDMVKYIYQYGILTLRFY